MTPSCRGDLNGSGRMLIVAEPNILLCNWIAADSLRNYEPYYHQLSTTGNLKKSSHLHPREAEREERERDSNFTRSY